MEQIDRTIHEPVRLRALTLLSGVVSAEFTFLLKVLNLTNGNLSVHMRKLEDAGYVTVTKEFAARTPRTSFAITREGARGVTGVLACDGSIAGRGVRLEGKGGTAGSAGFQPARAAEGGGNDHNTSASRVAFAGLPPPL